MHAHTLVPCASILLHFLKQSSTLLKFAGTLNMASIFSLVRQPSLAMSDRKSFINVAVSLTVLSDALVKSLLHLSIETPTQSMIA